MSSSDWTRTVYRLRRLPYHVQDATEAACLVSAALGISAEDVLIYSLATTCSPGVSKPSKIATLQLRILPNSLKSGNRSQQWDLPCSVAPAGKLVLDTHFEGMTVLSEANSKCYYLDCIALSGLGSHPFGSWQPRGDDKSYMWIRDEIPQSLPGVRTILYGYNSQLLKTKSFQTISDISLGFIHQLKAGGWDHPSSKPIIFLAHSLGGVVLKDAIVEMAGRGFSSSILDKIKGFVMLGVPSLGMYQSHLVLMTQGQPNANLIQDLSRENGCTYLRQLNICFSGLPLLKKVKIYWAYETKESAVADKLSNGTWMKTGTVTVLVSPDSATCNQNISNRAMTIPIDRDHSEMVKFSRGDVHLESILGVLRDLCSQQHPTTSSRKVTKL